MKCAYKGSRELPALLSRRESVPEESFQYREHSKCIHEVRYTHWKVRAILPSPLSPGHPGLEFSRCNSPVQFYSIRLTSWEAALRFSLHVRESESSGPWQILLSFLLLLLHRPVPSSELITASLGTYESARTRSPENAMHESSAKILRQLLRWIWQNTM